MFAFTLLPLASLAISSASALVVPRKSAPEGWAFGYLEDYDTYHTRYLAVGCHEKHSTEFFDQCCHPLLATENLQDNRPPQCTPSASASASASAAAPTSTIDPEEDDALDGALDGADECDDSDDDSSDEDEDEYEDCDEDDSDSDSTDSTPSPTPTPETPSPTPTPETPSSSASETPEPTSQEEPSPTTSDEAPAETGSDDNGSDDNSGNDNSGSGDNSGSEVHTGGFATFYTQDGNAGACGEKHSDNDLIAAIAAAQYGDLGQKSPLCGRQIEITNKKNQKSVVVVMQDACPGCKNGESIDLSVKAFTSIATEEEGMVEIEWKFVN